MKKHLPSKVKSLPALLFWGLVWALAAWALGKPLLLPSPLQVLRCMGRLALTADFWRITLTSIGRILLGLGLWGLGKYLDTLTVNTFWLVPLGLLPRGFASSDYFPLLPWLFLFWTGYFLYRLRPEEPHKELPCIPVATFMGRHSLVVYLLHQPAVYAVLTVWHLLF